MTKPLALVCPHRPPCPGCPHFGRAEPPPGAVSALAELAERAGAPAPRVVRGAVSGFRHRARLAIRGRAGAPKIGLFEEASHRVVHIPHCVVHHPLINRVTASVRRALAESRVPPYSDQAHAGVARYLQVVVERSSETAQIVLVTNTAERAPLASAFDALQGDLGATLHSLWQNPQLQRTNTILGPTFEHIAGPPSVRETLGGASVFYPPGAFGQNNLPLFERLVSEVQAAVPSQARIVELYAGVGAIGLGLAARSRSITFNELGADSLAGLERGIAALPPEVAARARVVAGSAAEHADLVGGADVVIADPPRRGLDRALIDALAARKPPLFVYVSCDLSTLLPQASELIERGLALRELSLYGLFPFTDHVETVAIFG